MIKNVSKYFRRMFDGKFSETVLDPDDGRYHIAAENFHPKALKHVMKIVHIKTKRLPRKLDLELLAHITVLIDYYDMKEAVYFMRRSGRRQLPERHSRRPMVEIWC